MWSLFSERAAGVALSSWFRAVAALLYEPDSAEHARALDLATLGVIAASDGRLVAAPSPRVCSRRDRTPDALLWLGLHDAVAAVELTACQEWCDWLDELAV